MSAAAEGRPGESHIPTDELLALSLASVTSQTDPSTDIPLLRKLAADGLVIAHKASINPETARFLNINLDVLVPSVNQFRVGFNSHVLAEAGAEQASVQRARRMVKGCNTFSAVMLNCDAVNGVLKAMGPETLAYHLDYVTSLYKNEVQLQRVLRYLRQHDAFQVLLDDQNSVWPEAVGVVSPGIKDGVHSGVSSDKQNEGRDFCLGYYAPIIAIARYTGALPDEVAYDRAYIDERAPLTLSSLGILPDVNDAKPPEPALGLYELGEAMQTSKTHNTLGISVIDAISVVKGNPEAIVCDRIKEASLEVYSLRDEILNILGASSIDMRTKDDEHIRNGLDALALALSKTTDEHLKVALGALGESSHSVIRGQTIKDASRHVKEAIAAMENRKMDQAVARKYLNLSRYPVLESICEAFDLNASDYAKDGLDVGRQDARKRSYLEGGYLFVQAIAYILDSSEPIENQKQVA